MSVDRRGVSRRHPIVYQIGVRSPGISWERRACVWESYEGRSYIWIRTGRRIAMLWIVAVMVFGLIAYGLAV